MLETVAKLCEGPYPKPLQLGIAILGQFSSQEAFGIVPQEYGTERSEALHEFNKALSAIIFYLGEEYIKDTVKERDNSQERITHTVSCIGSRATFVAYPFKERSECTICLIHMMQS